MLTLFAWNIGPMEIIVVLLLGVLLFGRRLPEIGRYLGKGIVEFKKGVHGLEDEVANTTNPPAQASPEAIRPPQRVGTTAPKFEDKPNASIQAPPQV